MGGGVNISGQEQVQRMISAHARDEPGVHDGRGVHGLGHADAGVRRGGGRFMGSLSVTLDIESMLRRPGEPRPRKSGFQITCLQDDGLEVYDTDEDQIGATCSPIPPMPTTPRPWSSCTRCWSRTTGTAYTSTTSPWTRELVAEVYWAVFGMHGMSRTCCSSTCSERKEAPERRPLPYHRTGQSVSGSHGKGPFLAGAR